jgi:cation:H+ antiporter
VRGALALAKRAGVSALLAGLVVVGFGTSAPELVVSLNAALAGKGDIALGNVIGSNIANILLVLGISALIMPLAVSVHCLRRDGVALLLATVVFMGCASVGGLSRLDGAILLLLLAAYLYWAYSTEKDDLDNPEVAAHLAEVNEVPLLPLPQTLLLTVGGLALLIVGADRFLLGAVGIAQTFGVPEAVIGLTLVAVGTSLPELAVSIIAAIKREADVAIGNIMGSGIFNLLCVLGVASVVQPLPFEGRFFAQDQWVLLATTTLFLVFLAFGLRLSRIKGAVLLVGYIAYMAAMFGLSA